MRIDPVERTWKYRRIRKEIEKLIDEKLKDYPRGLGFFHLYWGTKKRILKEKYDIDWSSPAELNLGIMFD